MKDIFLGFIAIWLCVFNLNAQEENKMDQNPEFKTAEITIKSTKDSKCFSYKSLNEFKEASENLFSHFDFDRGDYDKLNECEVVVEISIEISSGVISIIISGSISADFENAEVAAKRLRNMLLQAALS